MAITRRQFLRRTGLATAGAMFGPSLFGSPWLQRAMATRLQTLQAEARAALERPGQR